MILTLKNISINSFKGVENYQAELTNFNSFYGTNKTGKTTIANAISWCLFGKDIYGRTNYEIMPLDGSNEIIHHKEPSVELTYLIDGSKKVFKRVMTQKWVKKRGESESSFDGSCTTSYFVDEVPVKQKEYNDIVNITVSEDLFKALTLPTHFPSLDWKKRREIITSIIGDVDMEGISKREEFVALVEAMDGKSIDDYRKMVALQKKELKKAIDRIPASIEAAQQFIPEEDPDYSSVEAEIKNKKDQILSIDKTIADKSSVLVDFKERVKEKTKQISAIENKKREFVTSFTSSKQKEIEDIKNEKLEAERNIAEEERGLENLKQSLKTNQVKRTNAKIDLESLKGRREDAKNKYTSIKSKLFTPPKDDVCSHCGQNIIATADKIAEMELSFNNKKATELKTIVDNNAPLIKESELLENKLIPELNALIDQYETSIENTTNYIKELKSNLSTFTSRIAAINISKAKIDALETPEYLQLQSQLDDLSTVEESPIVDTSEYDKQKSILVGEIEYLQSILNYKSTIEKAKTNIEEYRKDGRNKSQELAKLESLEFATELFEKSIAEDVESRINKRLDGIVSFKMFHKQNNEGIKPTCDILINGVPFNSANTAAQIKAGLTIINLLSDHYDIHTTVVVDNRESIVEIPEIKSQIINLIVDENYSELTLKN